MTFIGITTPWGKRGWFYREWIGEEGVKDDWFRSKNPVTEIARIMNDPIKRAFLERGSGATCGGFAKNICASSLSSKTGYFQTP